MLYAVFLEVDQAISLEDYVVEHQVNVEVPASKWDVVLATNEGESFAQLQHEHTEIAGKGVFQGLLVPGRKFRKASEF